MSSLSPRKSFSPAPVSLTAYLWGSCGNNFKVFKEQLESDCLFIDVEPCANYVDLLLEELFRYLYILAKSANGEDVVLLSPSSKVDEALHCLLLNPILYHKICVSMLNLHGKGPDEIKVRVLPHNPNGAKDGLARKERLDRTFDAYEAAFSEKPPDNVWLEISLF